MTREKFGVAIAEPLADELDDLAEECADLGASRFEIIETIPTAYFESDVDHTARVRELIIRRQKANL
jgi:MoaA/NifB/PqqE/SkfB family radical SAM enzyme